MPPLQSEIAKQFQPQNPFFAYGQLQQWLALQQGQAVGRIVAAVNQRLIEREGQAIGLVGFFECVPEFEIAFALLETACGWLRQQGMIRARGPIDLCTHNNCLFQVEGFDTPPMFMMPYNPPYYGEFIEKAGWAKAKDAYAYNLPLDRPLAPEFEKAYRIASKSGIQFRPLRTQGEAFAQDCLSLYHLFNRAFANNWSSSPRSEAEFMAEAKALRSLVDPDIFILAEDQGEMVGFFYGPTGLQYCSETGQWATQRVGPPEISLVSTANQPGPDYCHLCPTGVSTAHGGPSVDLSWPPGRNLQNPSLPPGGTFLGV